jgi:hypothetical protein
MLIFTLDHGKGKWLKILPSREQGGLCAPPLYSIALAQ